MLRSVKYGLYGALLAGVVGGSVAFTASANGERAVAAKSVHLIVDGRARTVHTTARTVAAVLAAQGFRATGHDLVAPNAGSALHNGETIVLQPGRLLQLTIDGIARDVWTTAPTVAAAMSSLGFATDDFTSVSRSRRLPLGPTDIDIRTPKFVTVVHGTHTTSISTTDATVGQLLDDLSLNPDRDDRVTPAASTPLSMGMQITYATVVHTPFTKTRLIHYGTRSVDDPHLAAGVTKVVRAGLNGVKGVNWSLVYVNGKEVGRTKLGVDILRSPVTKLQYVGTKVVNGTPAAAGSYQAIARALLPKFGFGPDQFSCLVQMWNHESGWRTDAANPSGAYGIPQALPGSKMSSAGPNWETNPVTQIKWGLGYIKERYGTPCGAWGLWQEQGWY